MVEKGTSSPFFAHGGSPMTRALHTADGGTHLDEWQLPDMGDIQGPPII